MGQREEARKAREREVFERFATSAGLTTLPGTLLQPDPPQPDLSVEIRGVGRVAFELVRINDPVELTSLTLMTQTRRLLADEFARIAPAERHRALSASLADADIKVSFVGTPTLAERRKVLPFVWDMLEQLPAGFYGAVDLYDKNPPSIISLIHVARCRTAGAPVFGSMSVGYATPAAIDSLEVKLANTYASAAPLELLAYKELGEFSHLGEAEMVARSIQQALPSSQFRRVWVFEERLRRVACYPSRGETS